MYEILRAIIVFALHLRKKYSRIGLRLLKRGLPPHLLHRRETTAVNGDGAIFLTRSFRLSNASARSDDVDRRLGPFSLISTFFCGLLFSVEISREREKRTEVERLAKGRAIREVNSDNEEIVRRLESLVDLSTVDRRYRRSLVSKSHKSKAESRRRGPRKERSRFSLLRID